MILACSPIDTGVTSYLIDSALIYTSNYQARMAELYPQQFTIILIANCTRIHWTRRQKHQNSSAEPPRSVGALARRIY